MRGSARRAMRTSGLLVDTRPLTTSPAFRRLWWGLGASALGNQITVFAIMFQVHSRTHSPLAVGAIGLFTAIPAIALALVGGVVGDRVDRRKLVLATTSCQTLVAVVLAAQAWAELESVPLLYALVGLQFTLGSINVPAVATFAPRLLATGLIRAAAALRVMTMQLSLIAGPVLAGALADRIGVTGLYALDAVSFAAALHAIARLPAMVPQRSVAGDVTGWRSVLASLQFIAGNRAITTALLVDLSITLLGVPSALIPALVSERFGGTATVLGLLVAAPAIGGMAASVLSGPLRAVAAPARTMRMGCALWGAGVVTFGVMRSAWLGFAALVVIGAIDALVVVLRTSVVQLETPDGFRARVAAAEYIVGNAGPQLGNVRAGALAAMTSPGISAVVGGITTIAAAGLLAWFAPRRGASPVIEGARE